MKKNASSTSVMFSQCMNENTAEGRTLDSMACFEDHHENSKEQAVKPGAMLHNQNFAFDRTEL